MNIKAMKKIFVLLLALTLAAGVTACGKTGDSAGNDAADSACESITDPGKMTADGRFLSEEGVLAIPDEITLNGTKAAVGRVRYDGMPRLQAVTGEIADKTYTVRECGTVPASWVKAVTEHTNSFLFGIDGHAVAGEILENGTGSYLIKYSNDACILLSVFRNGIDEKEGKRMVEKEYAATRDIYDTLVVDFVNAAEIKWE